MSELPNDIDEGWDDEWNNEWDEKDPDYPGPAFQESMPIPARHATTIAALRAMESDRGQKGRRAQLIVFAILFGFVFELKTVAIIFSIFLIHDVVVYVVARSLKVNQERLFYLPVGRIVDAPLYNHDGWKVATVALVGPVVGLALGWMTVVYAGKINNKPFIEFGIVAVLLNSAYLTVATRVTDGGRFLESMFSCRWRNFEIVARIGAVAILGIYGWTQSEYLCLGFAVAILLNTRKTISQIRATITLEAETPQWDSIDGQRVPSNAAVRICDEIQHIYDDDTELSVRANAVEQIFQRLNLKPVGLAGGVVLGLTYLVALAAVASIIILIVAG